MFKKVKTVIKFFLFESVDFLVRLNKTSYISKTILLVKVDAIGDYILFRNFIEVLKKTKKYKDYKITLCGNEVWKDLAEYYDNQFINDFIWLNRKKFNRNIFYRYRKLKEISRRSFEVVIHPTFSRDFFCGDAIVKISNAREKIGSVGNLNNIKNRQKEISDKYYTKLISASDEILFEFYRNKEFLENLLCREILINKPYFNGKELKPNYVHFKNYAVIVPGAGAEFRCWNAERFVKISDYLVSRYQLGIVMLGGKKEKNLSANITNKVKTDKIKDLTSVLRLSEVVEIIRGAKIVISNETFAAHIAAAVDAFCVCVSNGNHFGRFNPYPKKISEKIITVYPRKIMDNLHNFDVLSQKYKNSSNLDINGIKPIDVKRVIDELLKTTNLKTAKYYKNGSSK